MLFATKEEALDRLHELVKTNPAFAAHLNEFPPDERNGIIGLVAEIVTEFRSLEEFKQACEMYEASIEGR